MKRGQNPFCMRNYLWSYKLSVLSLQYSVVFNKVYQLDNMYCHAQITKSGRPLYLFLSSLSISLFLYRTVSPSLHLSISSSLNLFLFLSVSPRLCHYFSPSLHLLVSLSLCSCNSLCLLLSVSQPLCLYTSLSHYLFVPLFFYIFM